MIWLYGGMGPHKCKTSINLPSCEFYFINEIFEDALLASMSMIFLNTNNIIILLIGDVTITFVYIL